MVGRSDFHPLLDQRSIGRQPAPSKSSQDLVGDCVRSRQVMESHQALRPRDALYHMHPTLLSTKQLNSPQRQHFDGAEGQAQQALAVWMGKSRHLNMHEQYVQCLPADFVQQLPQLRLATSHPGGYYPSPQFNLSVRTSFSDDTRGHRRSMEVTSLPYSDSRSSLQKSWPIPRPQAMMLPRTLEATARTSVGFGVPPAPRGPPIKPRQSGHALWVGNLPLSATVIDLKDHFSRDLTNDILSVKLMQRSSCAFVNYKTAEASQRAMQLFHAVNFHQTRLVCRLRKYSDSVSLNDPSTSIFTPPQATKRSNGQLVRRSGGDGDPSGPSISLKKDEIDVNEVDGPSIHTLLDAVKLGATPARYFVLKSLTFEDLVASTQNLRWTTQAHNEELLNVAYGVSRLSQDFHNAQLTSRVGVHQCLPYLLCQPIWRILWICSHGIKNHTYC